MLLSNKIIFNSLISLSFKILSNSSSFVILLPLIDIIESPELILGRPAYRTKGGQTRFYVASRDGYLTCLSERSGRLLWRFSAGEPLEHQPVVFGDGVYIMSADGGMWRINADSGQEEWWTPGIFGFVSASGNRLYCTNANGRIVIVDIATGGRRGILQTELLSVKLINTQTDRLYMGTRNGLLQCLHEPQYDWPLLHLDAEEETKDNRFCVGVRRRGREEATWVGADSIIHNGGHPNLIKALSDDFEVGNDVKTQIETTQAVGGIGFCFALDDDIPVRSSGVTMLPNLDRVGGFVIPTFSDPSLAPEGKHLMITHQYVPDASVKSEISKGREDLYEAIPWLADHGEEICVHTYHRNWPCNRAPQGAELPMDVGVDGIRCVGDGVKGHGWMMVEGISANVPYAVDEIMAGMN